MVSRLVGRKILVSVYAIVFNYVVLARLMLERLVIRKSLFINIDSTVYLISALDISFSYQSILLPEIAEIPTRVKLDGLDSFQASGNGSILELLD